MGRSEATGNCGGTKKSDGLPCTKPEGWGVEGATRGPCKLHGGTLPNVIKHHARAEMAELVAGQMGAVIPIDPLEGAQLAVGMAHGMVEYWMVELAKGHETDAGPSQRAIEGYRVAVKDFAHVIDLANKAGVADRLAQISERMADQITLACEAAFAAFIAAAKLTISPEQRTVFAQAVHVELAKLEQPAIEGTASEAA